MVAALFAFLAACLILLGPAPASAEKPASRSDLLSLLSDSPIASPGETRPVIKKSGRNFILVCPFMDEYWKSCAAGMERANSELGTKTRVITTGERKNYAARMADYMRQAMEARPDGIIAYCGLATMTPLLKEAASKGIPVIAIDSDANKSTPRVAYVGSDDYHLGYYAGESVVRLTGGTGKVGLLVSSSSAIREMDVMQAFRDSIADYDLSVVGTEETFAIPEVAEAKTRDMLEKHPEISIIFCTAGPNAFGAARAKKALNRKDLLLLGFDDLEENLKFLGEGIINAIIVQRPYQMGYWSVRLLNDYLDKGKLHRDSFPIGFTLVTKENMDRYKKEEREVHSILPAIPFAQ